MNRTFTSSMGAPKLGVLGAIKKAVEDNTFATVAGCESLSQGQDALKQIAGMEGFNPVLANLFGKASDAQTVGAVSAIQRVSKGPLHFSQGLLDEASSFAGVTGNEGFSNAQELGKSVDVKAVNIALNSLAHSQTDAAEEMFKTITLSDGEEQLRFSVRTAGLGRYVYGASAFDSASEMRPIMSLIRSGEYFIDETLQLHPVYPAEADSPARSLFISETLFKPWQENYSTADAMKRTSHLSNFLKVGKKVTNLLGLSEVKGQRQFDSSDDEIEQNSITVKRVALTVKIDGKDHFTSINCAAFTNNNYGVTNTGHSSDDRALNMRVPNYPASAFEMYDEDTQTWVPDTVMAGLDTEDYKCHFSLALTGTFWRQGYSIDTQAGEVELAYITNKNNDKFKINSTVPAVKTIYKRFTDGKVEGWEPSYYHNNRNRTNFGYRVELYDTFKVLTTKIQTPVSLKYPVDKEAVNDAALSDATDWVITTIQAQTTNAAFEAAKDHVAAVTRMSGSAIVGNEQGSNIMAGMHFVNATAIHRKIKLTDSVSTMDNQDMLANMSAMFVNNITEICGALETNSSLAAISEYRKIEIKWVVVGHQNLTRYLIRNGDVRTVGAGVSFKTVKTNLDPMIGKFYIFPESETTDTNIDVIGGMGVLVSKEHRVFQTNVTRHDADFGIMVTIPFYKHWSVCPIVGLLEIEDAHQALTDEGLLNYLNVHRVALIDAEGKPYKAGSAKTDEADEDKATDNDTNVNDLP